MPSPNLTPDPLIFDGGQLVTLFQKRAGTVITVTVRNATSGPLTNQQMASLGGLNLLGTERRWSLNADDVGPSGILPGDSLDDGANRWTILIATLATLSTRWRCIARLQL
jgi:hypothetical protein